ncbi:MAG: hypothetical protein EAZ55_01125 [Cytophagales bacterium]|nr:MAG: hypothetical protein EAZ55_01125 [Cytophagales bacterium]
MINEQFRKKIAPYYKKGAIRKIYSFEGMMDFEGVNQAAQTWLLGFDYFKSDGEVESPARIRHAYLIEHNFLTKEEHKALHKFQDFFLNTIYTGLMPMDIMHKDFYMQFLKMREELFALESLKQVLAELRQEYKKHKEEKMDYCRSYLEFEEGARYKTVHTPVEIQEVIISKDLRGAQISTTQGDIIIPIVEWQRIPLTNEVQYHSNFQGEAGALLISLLNLKKKKNYCCIGNKKYPKIKYDTKIKEIGNSNFEDVYFEITEISYYDYPHLTQS